MHDMLKAFGDKLNQEANVRIDAALDLFNQCTDNEKEAVLAEIYFTDSPTTENLRDHFDTLDLLDTLDDAVQNMATRLYTRAV